MPELLLTLEASRERIEREWEFHAAIQGAEWSPPSRPKSFEDVQARARIRAAGGNPDVNDVTNLRGHAAEQAGFGIGHGLGYETV
jgi:hypothetical protein